jgi:hypothetical protein
MSLKKTTKVANILVCEYCDYKCFKTNDFTKHLLTRKHKMLENASKMLVNASEKSPNFFTCKCGKSYIHDSSYYRHKKICKFEEKEKEKVNDSDYNNNINDKKDPSDKELIMLLIKENSELKTMMMKVLENGTHNTTNNTNSHNKAFNLNLFLNETCKDAMNISEFINSIKLNLDDLENTGKRGYIEGISSIILKNLNDLEQHMRPLHCSDLKREILYIKDNDQWTKETDNKPIFKKAIKTIANENIKQIKVWRDKNPDCTDPDSKKNNLYLQIVSNSMNGLTEEESTKNINKIISNVVKEVIIDKN